MWSLYIIVYLCCLADFQFLWKSEWQKWQKWQKVQALGSGRQHEKSRSLALTMTKPRLTMHSTSDQNVVPEPFTFALDCFGKGFMMFHVKISCPFLLVNRFTLHDFLHFPSPMWWHGTHDGRCDDMWWHVMTCDDMWWHVMTCDDMWWHVMTCDDMWWHVMTCDDMWWHVMTCDDMWWHVMTCDDMWWHVMTCDDMWWHVESVVPTWESDIQCIDKGLLRVLAVSADSWYGQAQPQHSCTPWTGLPSLSEGHRKKVP